MKSCREVVEKFIHKVFHLQELNTIFLTIMLGLFMKKAKAIFNVKKFAMLGKYLKKMTKTKT